MAVLLNTNYNNITEYPNTFKRQGAFPLEMYSVFTSKSAAEAYMNENPISYAGQLIAVANETGTTFYGIEKSGDTFRLKELAAGGNVDNAIATALADYSTTTEVEGLIADAVAEADHLKYRVVTGLSDITADAAHTNIIFLVPKATAATNDGYDEYMVVDHGEGAVTRYTIEKVGDWKVDLSSYATIEYVDGQIDAIDQGVITLGGRVDTVENKLATIEEGAQVNVIDAVNVSEFTITEGKTLNINTVGQAKISGLNRVKREWNGGDHTWTSIEESGTLADILVPAANGYDGLMTAEDKTRLNVIHIGSNGSPYIPSDSVMISPYENEGNTGTSLDDVIDGINSQISSISGEAQAVQEYVFNIETALGHIIHGFSVDAVDSSDMYLTADKVLFSGTFGSPDAVTVKGTIMNIQNTLTWGTI